MTIPPASTDLWSNWLLYHRSGSSPLRQATARTDVASFIDRLLEVAPLPPDGTLVDVGTGEGDVAWAAIARTGPSLQAILVDISLPLLRHAKSHALALGVASQCMFVANAADRLTDVRNDCADVVTTRAALAYVADKRAALLEFMRVLRPGGTLSIAEPVLQDEALELIAFREWLDARNTQATLRFLPLLMRWRAAQFPSTRAEAAAHPLTNFSERDLVALFLESGFVDVHLEFRIDVLRAEPVSWSSFLLSSPHPLSPTTADILKESFSADGRGELEQFLRPLVEAGVGCATRRIAYLRGRKPLA